MSPVRDSLDGMDLLPLLLCVLGLAVGAVAGWLLGRRSGTGADVEAERRAAAQRLADVQTAAEQRLADAQASFQQRLSDREAAWEQRLADVERTAAERLADAERSAAGRVAAERVAEVERPAAGRLRAEQEAAQLRLAELRQDQQRLKDEFTALSAKALEANSEAFLRQAEERLKRAQETSQSELAK